MARLLDIPIEARAARSPAHAREFAAAHRVHVVLKGHRTVIATPDGRTFVNLTGNAGMATGGTGDLLTGMIAAWFAQLLDAEAACKLAVYLHGAAGDLAEADEGEVALIAGDIAARLGDAMLELTARRNAEARIVNAGIGSTDHRAAREAETAAAGERWRRRSSPATSSCSTGSSAPARPRSSAASPAASAPRRTTSRARRSR